MFTKTPLSVIDEGITRCIRDSSAYKDVGAPRWPILFATMIFSTWLGEYLDLPGLEIPYDVNPPARFTCAPGTGDSGRKVSSVYLPSPPNHKRLFTELKLQLGDFSIQYADSLHNFNSAHPIGTSEPLC